MTWLSKLINQDIALRRKLTSLDRPDGYSVVNDEVGVIDVGMGLAKG
jgi:hypothetical protein